MASLTIPKQIVAGFTIVATIPEQSFEELISALNGIPVKILQHRVVDLSGLKLNTLSQEDTKAISDAIAPLYRVIAGGGVDPIQYASDIADSITDESHENTEWAQFPETLNQFKERLTRLITVPTVKLIAKAHDVLLEHAQTFSEARIVSDIRPVFGDTVDEEPSAAVIVHMLNIAYYQGGDRHEFVVALDTKDVDSLLDTFERAKKKADKLRSMMAAASMTLIEVE